MQYTRYGFTYELAFMIKVKRLSFTPTLEVGVILSLSAPPLSTHQQMAINLKSFT